jgi:undecaprenyl-diphosphatase
VYAQDASVTSWINAWSGLSPTLDNAMVWVSTIGVPLLVIAVASQWWLKADRRHTRHVLLATGFSFLLGLGLNQLILLLVHRIRPYDAGVSRLLIDRSADPSFPSDHATASFAIALAFLVFGFNRRGLAFLAMAGLIALSRIFIGTHYMSDVLGGGATAVVAVIIVKNFFLEGSRIDDTLTSIL